MDPYLAELMAVKLVEKRVALMVVARAAKTAA